MLTIEEFYWAMGIIIGVTALVCAVYCGIYFIWGKKHFRRAYPSRVCCIVLILALAASSLFGIDQMTKRVEYRKKHYTSVNNSKHYCLGVSGESEDVYSEGNDWLQRMEQDKNAVQEITSFESDSVQMTAYILKSRETYQAKVFLKVEPLGETEYFDNFGLVWFENKEEIANSGIIGPLPPEESRFLVKIDCSEAITSLHFDIDCYDETGAKKHEAFVLDLSK